jgi:hypothetical protein
MLAHHQRRIIGIALLLSTSRAIALQTSRQRRWRTVVACACAAERNADRWHEVRLSGGDHVHGLNVGQSIEQGDTILMMPKIATADECKLLAIAAKKASDDNKRASGLHPSSGDIGASASTGRIPSIAAAAGCAQAGVACVPPLPLEADQIADTIMNRVLALIDDEIPTLVPTLFGPTADSLVGLRELGALCFHAREPAINVYDVGGEFLPHMVRQAREHNAPRHLTTL